MKIVFVIPHMNVGGAQRVCYNLIGWLQEHTDEIVHLIVYSDSRKDYGFDLSDIPHSYARGGLVKKMIALRKELKRLNPDVVITMGVPGVMFDIPAMLGLKMKHIVSERNDPAHFAGRTSTRIVSRALMRLADGYVFQTDDAQSFYGGSIARRSIVIPNPLFNVEKMPISPCELNTKTIVSVGRLNKQKNQSMLIEAYAKVYHHHPEYKLVIYGEGPERSKLEELVRSLGIQDVCELPGATSEVLEKIYCASLFVLPSDFEGMPNALMEAMALGLPCISTDCPCGGPRELIRDGENGLLVPVGDKVTLVSAMEKMINDREMALRMGKNALGIRDTHSMDVICLRWLDYFKQVVGA